MQNFSREKQNNVPFNQTGKFGNALRNSSKNNEGLNRLRNIEEARKRDQFPTISLAGPALEAIIRQNPADLTIMESFGVEQRNKIGELIWQAGQNDQGTANLAEMLHRVLPAETTRRLLTVISIITLFGIVNTACTPTKINASENNSQPTISISIPTEPAPATEVVDGVEVTATPDIGEVQTTESGLNFGEGINSEQQADAEEFYATDDGAQQTADLLSILQAEGVVNLEFVTLIGFYINPNNPEDIRAFIEISDDSYQRASHLQFISPLNDREEPIFLSKESASEALGISDVDFYQDSEGFLRIFTEVNGVKTDVGIVNKDGQYSGDIPTSLTGLRAFIAESNVAVATEAATEVATSEPTEVVTLEAPYTGIEGFPETWSYQFPETFNSSLGAYDFYGVIKEISFNYEGEKLASGSNIEATSFLLVSYYDSKGQVQEILVGSSFHDETYGENGNAMIFGRGTNNSRILPDYFIDGAVKEIHSVGDIITIIFGTPNSTIARMDGTSYTNDLINSTHTEAQFAAFAATGDPSDLGSEVLVPFIIFNQLNN